jgi:hypothetical protein
MVRVRARRTRASSKGFFGGKQIAAVEIALLDGDLVAERADEFVAGGGRQIAEIDRGPIAADCVDPDGLLGSIEAGEAIEVRQPLVIVIRVAHTLDR